MSSLTQSADFKNYATFILRINDCSIYKKDFSARMDAGYFVVINYHGKQYDRTNHLSDAIKSAMQTQNSKRGYLRELTKQQRERIAPILRKFGESIKDLD